MAVSSHRSDGKQGSHDRTKEEGKEVPSVRLSNGAVRMCKVDGSLSRQMPKADLFS